MSAKKVFETKFFEDENADSGFVSGPLSEQLSSEDLDYRREECEDEVKDTKADSDKKVKKESAEDSDNKVYSYSSELDSGCLDLHLPECLANVKLSDSTLIAQPPLIVLETEKSQDFPPLDILFQQDDDGDTQLHIAAVHGCEKSVGTLIRVCPDAAWFDVPNDYGHTPLHLAAMSGYAVVTRMLVRAGASLSARDFAGETAVHKAVAGKHIDCLHALMAPVPEHPPRNHTPIINQKNYNGQTCVHIAAAAGHIDMLQALVCYKADINAREGLAGWSALHAAAARGDAATAGWLVKHGEARARDYAGRSPRRLAARAAHARLAARLAAAAGASSDEDDDDDEYDSDSDAETLFDRIRQRGNPINVA